MTPHPSPLATHSTPRTAALLAGGRSLRMGRDKAFLTHQGRPLWQHQAETLRASGATRWLLSCRQEQGLEAPATEWSSAQNLPVQIILDPDAGDAGMLGAVARCLRLAGGGLLILTVDMPHLNAALLEPLWPQSDDDTGGFWQGPRGIEPFPGYFPASLLPVLEEELKQQRSSALKRLLETAHRDGLIRAQPIAAEDVRRLANWNTPEEVASL